MPGCRNGQYQNAAPSITQNGQKKIRKLLIKREINLNFFLFFTLAKPSQTRIGARHYVATVRVENWEGSVGTGQGRAGQCLAAELQRCSWLPDTA